MYSNSLKEWTNELAKQAVDSYLKSKSFTLVAEEVKKTPIEVEAFLNYIGAAETYNNPKNSVYSGFPRDCYRDNSFEQIIMEQGDKSYS